VRRAAIDQYHTVCDTRRQCTITRHVGRCQVFCFGSGARPKRVDRGWGFGKGQPAPLLQLGDLGSAVSSIAGSGAAAKRFSCILEAPDSLSWYLLGAKFGQVGGVAPLPPLNLPVQCTLYSQLLSSQEIDYVTYMYFVF